MKSLWLFTLMLIFFSQSHHLALLEALMSAHVFSVVKIPHVVRVVRCVQFVNSIVFCSVNFLSNVV